MTTPTHMPSGRYKGKKISEVPSDYLDWALKNLNDDHLLCAIEREYEIREETHSHFYMAKKRIKISSAKAKGRGLQQWVCKKISELTGYEYGSSGDDKPIESRPMGQMGCDVRMESQVKKLFPYSVECKRCENWSIPAWIKQAKENQAQNTDWLLIIKKSHEDPIAIIDANLFFEIQGALLFWKNKAKIKETP